MVQDKNKPDLVKTPITLAGKMFQSGLEHLQGSILGIKKVDPIQQLMDELGLKGRKY
jgi:hypothetical protein